MLGPRSRQKYPLGGNRHDASVNGLAGLPIFVHFVTYSLL